MYFFNFSEALLLMRFCRRLRGQWQNLCYLRVLDKLGFGLGLPGMGGGQMNMPEFEMFEL